MKFGPGETWLLPGYIPFVTQFTWELAASPGSGLAQIKECGYEAHRNSLICSGHLTKLFPSFYLWNTHQKLKKT